MNNGSINAKDLDRIKRLRLIDDVFMSKCFEDNIECTELVVRIVLNRNDIKVRNVHVQHSITNLQGKSTVLDIYAVDDKNKLYNIEIQRANDGAKVKRARYHSSLIDANILRKGDDTEKLPETYVIFITEHDILKENRPIYHIERTITENGKNFGDGSHIIFVNGQIKGQDPLGKLMQDFFCEDPNKMNYKVLADRTRDFKENKEGTREMKSVVDEIREEGERNKGIKTAINMIKLGKLSYDDIAACTELPVNEIIKLAQQVKSE